MTKNMHIGQDKKILELEEENARLKNIIDSIPGSIYWKDKNGVYLGRNLYAAEKSYSVHLEKKPDKEEPIGKTDYDYMPKDVADQYRKHDLEVMQKGKDLIREEYITLPSGEKLTQLSYKKPLRDKQGNIVGIIGNTIDITDRKKAEEKALQLEKEKAIIETKRQTIAALASSVAHEVGNLLGGIMINAQLLGYSLKPKVAELIGKHDDKCQDILGLFNDLAKSMENARLMFESIKMNIRSGSIDKSQFKPAHIVHDVETVLTRCFPGEEIVANIKWNKEQDFEYMGIPSYTCNILINLIKNALYYVKEEKKGKITITLKKGEKFNTLIFEDTAKGVPKKLLPKIFTHFSTTRKGGSGMGLAFCKMVMQAYGGNITCESELNKYARFILTFPKTE